MLFLTFFVLLLSFVLFSFAQTTDDIPSCVLECLGPDLQALNGRYVLGVPVKYCPSKDLLCRCKDPGWVLMMTLCSDPCPEPPKEDICEAVLKKSGLNVTAVYEEIDFKLSATPTPWLSVEGNLYGPTTTSTSPAAEETSPPTSVRAIDPCAFECLHLNTPSPRSSELGIPVGECGEDWECRCTNVGWFVSWNMCGDFCDDAEAAFKLTCKGVYARLGISDTEVARRFLHDLKVLGKDPETVPMWLKFNLEDQAVKEPAGKGAPVGELRM